MVQTAVVRAAVRAAVVRAAVVRVSMRAAVVRAAVVRAALLALCGQPCGCCAGGWAGRMLPDPTAPACRPLPRTAAFLTREGAGLRACRSRPLPSADLPLPSPASSNMSNALANAVCQRCQARFAPAERIVNSNGELYHEHCFVCAQCFRPFPEGLFYEVRTPPGPCAGRPSSSLSPGAAQRLPSGSLCPALVLSSCAWP